MPAKIADASTGSPRRAPRVSAEKRSRTNTSSALVPIAEPSVITTRSSGVLAAAVIVDALARRSREASGRI